MIKSTIREAFEEPYRIDGDILLDMLMEIVRPLTERSDLEDLRIRVTRKTRNGIETIENTSNDVKSLFDGVVPKPDCLDIEIHGNLRSLGPEGSFLFTLRLDRRFDNVIYAHGPSKEAEAAFETIRNAMKAAVVRPKPMPEPMHLRLRRRIATSGVYYTLLALTLSCIMVGAFTSTTIMIAGYVFLIMSLALLWMMPRSEHVSWEDRMKTREAERSIDLSNTPRWREGVKHLKSMDHPEKA